METKQGWYKYLDQFSNPPLLRLVLHSADKLQCIRREKSWLKLFLILWDYAWCEIKYLEWVKRRRSVLLLCSNIFCGGNIFYQSFHLLHQQRHPEHWAGQLKLETDIRGSVGTRANFCQRTPALIIFDVTETLVTGDSIFLVESLGWQLHHISLKVIDKSGRSKLFWRYNRQLHLPNYFYRLLFVIDNNLDKIAWMSFYWKWEDVKLSMLIYLC